MYLIPIVSLLLLSPTVPPGELPEAVAGQRAGLQVVVDPATGEIIDNPTHLELERLPSGLTRQRRRSARELRDFPLAGGGRGVYLDGWADHSLKARVDGDGRLRLECSQGDEHPTKAPGGEESER